MTLDYFYGQAGELFSFFRIPKALFQEQRFQDLSTDAKTLYGILLDRMSLSVKNEWFDKKGRVFIIFTIEDVKRTLRCADNKATRLLRELEKFGLIERKRRGQGKPCLVYVKNFSSESSKESVKNRDNDDSCGSKIACQDPVKSRGIKKRENKTEMNNTNLILSDESEKILLTMTDSRTIYGQQISNLIRQAYGKHLKVFDQTIPRSVRAAETSTTGKSIFQYDPKGKVAEAYHSIAKGVLADAEKRIKRQSEQLR